MEPPVPPSPGPHAAAGPSTSSAVAPPGAPSPAARTSDPDADVLRRHIAGDPDAFGELFRAHADRLWSVAFGLLRDPEEAADAVQEAMLAAHRRARTFRGEATVATWLHRIVANAALDRLRRRAVRPTVPMPTGPDGEPYDPVDTHDAISAQDTRMEIGAALDVLPAPLRAAVVLVDMEGLPVAEAARLLDIPVGTVKSRCSRARARLAILLGHFRPGNPAADPSVSDEGHPVSAEGQGTAIGRLRPVQGHEHGPAQGLPPGRSRTATPRPPSPRHTERTSRDNGWPPHASEEVIGGGD